MRQSSFTEALAILLKLLEQTLERVVGFSKEQIECFVQCLLSNSLLFSEDDYYFRPPKTVNDIKHQIVTAESATAKVELSS